MELYLVRHGQTDGTTNPADPPLTALGREQAAALGEALAGVRFDLIAASHLTRAVETAAAVARRQPDSPQILIDPAFAECGTPEDFFQSPETLRNIWKNVQVDRLSLPQFENDRARADACLERIRSLAFREENAPENLLIVAHGTFNAYLIGGLVHFPFDKNVIISQYNACVNRFSFFTENGARRVRFKAFNDVRHLRKGQIT